MPHTEWHTLVGEETKRVETHQSWDVMDLLVRRKAAGREGTGKDSQP